MRKAVSYILALFVMFDMILLVLSSSFLLTFGRKSYYLSRFQSGSYISACTTGIANGVTDLSLACGIPQKAVSGAISKKDVSTAVRGVIDNYFMYISGQSPKLSVTTDTGAFTLKLRKSIRSYAKSSGTTLSADTKKAVESYIKKCDNVFSSNLVQIPYFDTVAVYLRKLLGLLRILTAVSAILLAGLVAASFAVGRGNLLSRLLYPAYGVACAGALAAIPAAAELISGISYRINLNNSAEKEIAGDLFAGYFSFALILALVVFAVGIVASIVISKSSKARRLSGSSH